MYSSAEAQKLRVYIRNKKGKLKKYGKVHQVIFHPSKPLAIGIAVKRPDLLLMKKRDDRFVAMDRLKRIDEGLEIVDGNDSWGVAACKRLGVEYDKCIIWDYMPVKTTSGKELGLIKDILVDEETFKVENIDISPSSASRAILGAARIPVNLIRGYHDGSIVVKDEAASLEEAGGVAAKAGEAWAKGKHDVQERHKEVQAKAEVAGERAEKKVNEGAYKAGKSIGKTRKNWNDAVDEHLAKKEAEQKSGKLTGVDKAANDLGKQLGKAGRMFKDFKKEFDEQSRDDN